MKLKINNEAHQYAVDKFSDEQLEEYRDVFRIFDKDDDGVITIAEMMSLLRSLGQSPRESEVKELFYGSDSQRAFTIDFPEFIYFISKHLEKTDFTREIREAFNAFDVDNDGLLSIDDLQTTVNDNPDHIDLKTSDIDLLIKNTNPSEDGKVNFENFRNVIYDQMKSTDKR
ncbi:hypothetical protein GJ496_007941 [Pomphorhynchus laevis]|nr:hypothetical protein GJ496_007941 [Pomphorhynchus laevis]